MSLKQLPLWQLHRQLNARMMPFAGWEMPQSYEGQSVMESVKWTRKHVSVFDVSHMVQTEFSGPEGIKLLRWLTPADIDGLGVGRSRLCLILDQRSHILDDAVVSRLEPERYRLVTNASTEAKVSAHFTTEALSKNSDLKRLDGLTMLSIQGPESERIISNVLQMPLLSQWTFMQSQLITWYDDSILLSRSGYTGEDGFEVTCSPNQGSQLFKMFLSQGAQPAGLLARDILRIEAGLLLNGQDMDDTTLPGHVGLGWTISQQRLKLRDFCGSPIPIADKHLYGYVSNQPLGPLPRNGMSLLEENGLKIGIVTSGCHSPCLNRNVCLAIIDTKERPGTAYLNGGREPLPIYTATKLPFIPHKYKK